ncbi:MAG: hypothetical protein Q7T33_07810 [Dehalococcoidia bacterium]|nr:hypothetical protein [Dehalococcoidia bacterium]
MQTDGNLVIYNTSGWAIWASNTWGYPGAYLLDQQDANTVIYWTNQTALWATNTCCRAQPNAHSWYIKNTYANPDAATMYSIGYWVDGAFDNSTCSNSLVVLDFGQPDYVNSNYGTNYWLNYSPGYKFISNADIITAVDNYARGWYDRTGSCPRLHIVVGTNNSQMTPSGGTPNGAGTNWANVAYAVQSYLSNAGYSWQITAWAGSDMEQPGGEIPPFDCAGRTREFVDGYNSNSLATSFLDYGTAWVPNGCWTAADVYYVAYGAARNYPLPEVYTQFATDSWVSVRQQGYMSFKGVMTECSGADALPMGSCWVGGDINEYQFSPTQAWNSLWNTLNSNGFGLSSLEYATNIKGQ